MNILVIAPHPDDEVLGCGGTIARHVAQGDTVSVLVVTRGVSDLFPHAQVQTTRTELRTAHNLLGIIATHFLDFPAPELDTVPIRKIAEQIGSIIRQFRPLTIYLPYVSDLHVDHRIVYDATLVAARPIHGSTVQRLLCYETLSETEWASPYGNRSFFPTVFVNIGEFLGKKLEAMACYQSQLREFPHPRSLRAIEAQAHLRGSVVGFNAAEAFVLLREILD